MTQHARDVPMAPSPEPAPFVGENDQARRGIRLGA
jgi:hypothetical protein